MLRNCWAWWWFLRYDSKTMDAVRWMRTHVTAGRESLGNMSDKGLRQRNSLNWKVKKEIHLRQACVMWWVWKKDNNNKAALTENGPNILSEKFERRNRRLPKHIAQYKSSGNLDGNNCGIQWLSYQRWWEIWNSPSTEEAETGKLLEGRLCYIFRHGLKTTNNSKEKLNFTTLWNTMC